MSHLNQQDALEVELIRSLFDALPAALIMTAIFFAAAGLTVWQTRDPVLAALLLGGALTSAGRIAVLLLRKQEMRKPDITIERARTLQRHFAITYLGFGIVLGMFGASALTMPWSELHMLIICMLVGYGAGVASNICLRPRIAIPSIMASSLPAIIVAIGKADIVYGVTGLLTAAFLLGGINAIRGQHARAVQGIGQRLTFSTLARQDGLTLLPNRLALREWFEARVTRVNRPGMVAAHYLDLNGFKPVNDRYGHPVGDALLIAVARRITHTIRASDTAARLGGDEFVVLQSDISSADEAALLAQRLAKAIARPYCIEEHTIQVSTCVGYVVAEHGAEDMECLLSLADEALYAGKRTGQSVTRWDPDLVDPERAAA
jgi:diguanylate cyclase (GGDEF)-like protein